MTVADNSIILFSLSLSNQQPKPMREGILTYFSLLLERIESIVGKL